MWYTSTKKEDKQLLSLLPICAKVFEELLELKNFRPGDSITNQLIDFVHEITNHLVTKNVSKLGQYI